MKEFVIELCGQEYRINPPVLIPGQDPDQVFLEALRNAKLKPAPTEEEKKARRDRERQEQAERSRVWRKNKFEKAEKLSNAEWVAQGNDPVWCPFDRGWEDGFFTSIEAYLEWEADQVADGELEESDRPNFLWATKSHGLDIDVDRILENACDEMFDNARERLQGVEELTAAIDVFLEKNESCLSYEPDFSRVIVLDRS